MKNLHKAALKRAYRTLAQGLGSSVVLSAGTALIASAVGQGEQTLRAAGAVLIVSAGTAVLSAVGSFWQGVAQGLPEATDD